MKGLPIVLSGPSGCGKTTLSKMLLDSSDRIHESISYTTRPPRRGEENGVHYHFVSDERFAEMVAQNAFLESSVVHGFSYGTSAEDVERRLAEENDVLFVLDIAGGTVMHNLIGAINIFIVPPSVEALEDRLIRRGTDSSEVICKRMDSARNEIAMGLQLYPYVIMNSKVESALSDIMSIIRVEKIRRNRISIANNFQ
jgi:guanylate kinase